MLKNKNKSNDLKLEEYNKLNKYTDSKLLFGI